MDRCFDVSSVTAVLSLLHVSGHNCLSRLEPLDLFNKSLRPSTPYESYKYIIDTPLS